MSDETRGIYRKFKIERTDGSSGPGGKHEECAYFVLDLKHDKFSRDALRAYMGACRREFPALAEDIAAMLLSGDLDADANDAMRHDADGDGRKEAR